MTPCIACFMTKNCTDVGPCEKIERFEAVLEEDQDVLRSDIEELVAVVTPEVVAVVAVIDDRSLTTREAELPTAGHGQDGSAIVCW
mmetsp:Transcript_10864/g.23973  ORF Transcript_10864/g.23973 Transcript_10864/m.23973 type:complete len:86 (+) Transcript_10864:393-650(+)